MKLFTYVKHVRSMPVPPWLPWLHAALVVMLLVSMQKPFFYPDLIDGFSNGMRFIAEHSRQDWGSNRLYWVHLVRFFTIYPFWLVKDLPFASLFNALSMVTLLWPLAACAVSKEVPAHPLRCLLFYLPLFVSFRAVMVVAGIGYMFLMFFGKLRFAPILLLSVLFANFSSASVIVWLIGMLIQLPQFRRRPSYYLVVALALLSLGASLSEKIPYFREIAVEHQKVEQAPAAPAAPVDLAKNIIGVAVHRNTVIVSMDEGNLARAGLYTAIMAMLLYALYPCLRQRALRRTIGLFLVACLPVFFLEGLGVLSLLGPLTILLSELSQGRISGSISPILRESQETNIQAMS